MPSSTFRLNPGLYLRDPQQTMLGQKIVRTGAEMIDRFGFEAFTFRKLAVEIGSTEASVYRYFENKHRLLFYLSCWYWKSLEDQIEMRTVTLADPIEKLRTALAELADEKKLIASVEFIDEAVLRRIVISEFARTYLTRTVNEDDSAGMFDPFKMVCSKIAGWIAEISPGYPHPGSLAATILLAINQQLYFGDHLPSISCIRGAEPGSKPSESLDRFINNLLLSVFAAKA